MWCASTSATTTSPGTEDCLKPGITFEQLDRIANAQSDLAAATRLNTEQRELFRARRRAKPENNPSRA